MTDDKDKSQDIAQTSDAESEAPPEAPDQETPDQETPGQGAPEAGMVRIGIVDPPIYLSDLNEEAGTPPPDEEDEEAAQDEIDPDDLWADEPEMIQGAPMESSVEVVEAAEEVIEEASPEDTADEVPEEAPEEAPEEVVEAVAEVVQEPAPPPKVEEVVEEEPAVKEAAQDVTPSPKEEIEEAPKAAAVIAEAPEREAPEREAPEREAPEREAPAEANAQEPEPRQELEVVTVAEPLRPSEAVEKLGAILSELADIARSQGMRTLASEVTSDRLPALQEGRVTVVVLGEFNHGKSSILNALLGEEVLPTGITPTTAVITHLRYADKPQATIQYDAQDRKTVPLSELPSHVAAEQSIDPQFVEVGYPSEILRDNLVLVDTPGVNDISRQRVEITYGYVPRADVILYVLDAGQVLKRSEISFIRDRLLRSCRDRLIFVLGKVDALSESELEEVEDYAREKLGEMLDKVELYPVSARRAMEGHDEGFTRFRAAMLSYLRDRKSYILIDSGVGGALRVAGMLQQNLAIKRSSYQLNKEELQARVDAVHARLLDARRAIYENLDLIDETTSGLKATVRHNLREFTRRFSEAYPGEVERATVTDIKAHLPDWIRDTFRQWLEEEGGAIARELEKLAKEVIETTNANLREAVDHMQDEFGTGSGKIDLEINTLTYDIGVYTLGAAGVSIALLGSVMVGGLFLVAAPLLALVVKDRVEERTRDMAREQGLEAIRQAGEKLEVELIKVIEDNGDKLKTFVESAGTRLYRQINEVLQQVQRDTESVGADRVALDRRATEALARVEALHQELHAIRAALVTPE